MGRLFHACTLVLALGACATPQTQTPGVSDSAASAERGKQEALLFKANVEAARRLAELSDGMVIKGADLCESKIAPKIGLRLWSAQVADGKMAATLQTAYGLGDEVT